MFTPTEWTCAWSLSTPIAQPWCCFSVQSTMCCTQSIVLLFLVVYSHAIEKHEAKPISRCWKVSSGHNKSAASSTKFEDCSLLSMDASSSPPRPNSPRNEEDLVAGTSSSLLGLDISTSMAFPSFWFRPTMSWALLLKLFKDDLIFLLCAISVNLINDRNSFATLFSRSPIALQWMKRKQIGSNDENDEWISIVRFHPAFAPLWTFFIAVHVYRWNAVGFETLRARACSIIIIYFIYYFWFDKINRKVYRFIFNYCF